MDDLEMRIFLVLQFAINNGVVYPVYDVPEFFDD